MQGNLKCKFRIILDIPDPQYDKDAYESYMGEFQSTIVSFNKLEAQRKLELAISKDPKNDYRLVCPGINFEGTCNNRDCIAGK